MLRNELKDNIVLMNLKVNDCHESVLLFNLVPTKGVPLMLAMAMSNDSILVYVYKTIPFLNIW